jgi:P27 family predicted phage terminase small subunit
MGRRGPRPTPTALLKARGTYRADRARKNEVKGPSGIPRCPAGLDKAAKKSWNHLIPMLMRMGVLSRADRNAIIRYCTDWSRWNRLQQFLAKNGECYPIKDGNGNIKSLAPFPHATTANKLSLLLTKFEQEFGMTPSARTRIECSGAEDEDETIEEYLEGRAKEERFFGKKANGTSAADALKLLRDGTLEHVLKIAPDPPRPHQPPDLGSPG